MLNANKSSPAHLERQITSFVGDTPEWLAEHWLSILIATGIAAGIVLLLHTLRSWGMRLCRNSESGGTNWYTILGRTVARTGNFFILMTAIRLVVNYAQTPALLDKTVTFLFTVAAAFQAAIWVREVIFGLIEHRTHGDKPSESLASAIGIIRLLISIALFAIALVMVLSNVGVNVTGLVAGLGVGGIAIGLAAQGIFGDLIAALSILFDRPFRVGDNIKFDQTSGTVEGIGLKSTRVRSFDGEMHIISNRQLLDKELQNLSDRTRIRLPFKLGVAYETPPDVLDRLPEILKDIVEANGATAVRNGFSGFGASSLDYELIAEVHSSDWNIAHPTRDRIATGILRKFAEEGISIPYPTQTSFTAAPDGKLILPYPDVQPVLRVDKDPGER
ncbi:mechanosensitive ion channel family protein [Sphingomonas sp. HT-1]|uniref:mechanosensitive ion channel family protein n=1 Tax=unclassified Sphingomonas TaxID=196159 RepID=UPI0002EC1B2B|nr:MULTISPECIES: mechanosensitive ion channel family protein [unclassified Sphingomonas]KTF68441.1 mechanosensitive ion channel protein MscS [Sphingomonas sp. WG]